MAQGEIAIVGVAGRFPGAAGVQEFWAGLREGAESLTRLDDERMRAAGVAEAAIADPATVRLRGELADATAFDAAFFGYSPREAATMDPQQRLLLECAWHAFEDAGIDPARHDRAVGVFAGVGPPTYLLANVLPARGHLRSVGEFAALLGNEKDLLAPRISHKLDLRGPSITVQTGCSTSLVAVHLAVQSLLCGECEVALAAGATVSFPRDVGTPYVEGGIGSPDGRCRAYSTNADGTALGEAVAVVVLRRLTDALADGDRILGVIRGSAVNNDGSEKSGFTAPSVTGQAAVIAEAMEVAGVQPEDLDYVEGHGTGTPLGDQIEILALTEALGGRGDVAIGSVKPNIGHTDTAAGLAGLIKILLAFGHEQLPPTINATPSSTAFHDTPLHPNTELRPWPRGSRVASVSSFSVGGTNAHVVLGEPPAPTPGEPEDQQQLILASARDAAALERVTGALAAALDSDPAHHAAGGFADAAATLQSGRRPLAYRAAATAGDAREAAETLSGRRPGLITGIAHAAAPVVLAFPGQGSQRAGMLHHTIDSDPRVAAIVDHCAALLHPELSLDIREAMRTGNGLAETALAQPALFVAGYAIGARLMEVGVEPVALIGHSVGELAAAALSGAIELPEALAMVAERGRLIQAAPEGAMAAVPLPKELVEPLLSADVDISAVNGPEQVVIAGPIEAVERSCAALAEITRARGVGEPVRLRSRRAFHSRAVAPAAELFALWCERLRVHRPQIPLVSGRTGGWLTRAQELSAAEWGRQLREPVRFDAVIDAIAKRHGDAVIVECGPGRVLHGLFAQHGRGAAVVPGDGRFPELLARLWVRGAEIDWPRLHPGRRRRSVLPGYPFARTEHLVTPAPEERGQVFSPLPLIAAGAITSPRPAVGSPPQEGHRRPLADPAPHPDDTPPTDGPTGPIEQALCEIWAEALGLERVGVNDDFFDLGGHSLLATRIAHQVRRRFPVQMSGTQVLVDAPTIAAFAGLIETQLAEKLAQLSEEDAARLLMEEKP